jgi:MmyB-like transcription regulator ligand binding domain
MIGTPALVFNARLDIVTANELGYTLFSPVYADPLRPANNARFVFLDPHATEFFRDWDKVANDTVAILHAEAGRHPYDRRLFDLIGELSTRSDDFRRRWAVHDVQIHTTGSSSSVIRASVTSTCHTNLFRWLPISARASSPTPPTRITHAGRPDIAGHLGRQHHAPQQRQRAREHLTTSATSTGADQRVRRPQRFETR